MGYFKRAAEEWDNRTAQHCLGVMYMKEQGVARNFKEALKWLLLAANKGWTDSMMHAAAIYHKGAGGVKKDYKQAIFWQKKVIEKIAENCKDATRFTLFGHDNIEIDFLGTLSVLEDKEKSAASSSSSTTNTAPKPLLDNKEIRKKAIFWHTIIRNYDPEISTDSQGYLGLIYYWGGPNFAPDYKNAYLCFMEAAKAENTIGKIYTGICYQEGHGVKQNHNSAMYWYTLALENGDNEALLRISSLYQEGHGVKKNYKTAIAYLDKYLMLARQDDIYCGPVYSKIGRIYDQGGYGIKQDYKKAFECFVKADEYDLEEGTVMVATYYGKGFRVEQSYKKAFEYFSKAAANNSGTEQLMLGVIYIQGQYVKQDFSKALHFFKKSCKNGCEKEAKIFMDQISLFRLMAEMQVDAKEERKI
jgi:TPR repeat protein